MARKSSPSSSKGKQNVHKVMKEHKEGKLRSPPLSCPRISFIIAPAAG